MKGATEEIKRVEGAYLTIQLIVETKDTEVGKDPEATAKKTEKKRGEKIEIRKLGWQKP